MDFLFEVPSDEEHSGDDNNQSPWDLGAFSDAVAEEHARRNTTSIDEKISRIRQQRSVSLPDLKDDHFDSESDSEPHRQEDYKPEEGDEEPEDNHGSNKQPFCESSEGVSFHAKTFRELNLSRPLLKACKSLGYSKPTPIQAACIPLAMKGRDICGSAITGSGKEDYKPEEGDEEPEDNHGSNKQPFCASSEGVSFHAKTFRELNLSRPLLNACKSLGYSKPTPIQAACIPLAMKGRDICGSAITGSGKTAAFSLPTLQRLLYPPKRVSAIRVLILTPTRELAVQVHSMIEKLAQFTDIRCCLIIGGLSDKVQASALRSMPDIVVATPGRMIDHLRNSMSVDLDDLAVLILDEADRLLELGFTAEIQELVRMCPKRRQTMLFSATMTEQMDQLVKLSLTKPLRLSADPSTKRPSTLTEEVVRIRRMREAHQEAVLLALCSKTFTSRVIIFCGARQAAHRLKILFGLAGFKATELHSNRTQAQRLDAIELFRKQEVDFLMATDVAARGLDIVGVQTVINMACPRDLTTYVHRVGRTARAGRPGCAVTFVTDNDRSLLKAIAKRAGSKLKSRIVAEVAINKWCEIVEQMEDQFVAVLREEREEMIFRKAEMEAAKAENMIEHKDEIFSRPKKTWFITEREKKLMAKASMAIPENDKSANNEVVSAEQAEELKMKEKRKREHEKKLPRKKRRKLEAEREMLEDDHDSDDSEEESGKGEKDKSGIPLVDVAYRLAKAAKGAMKAQEGGKKLKNVNNRGKQPQSRTEEMQDLFQSDMSERRQKKTQPRAGKKSKNSFKSKSRYKRR